MAQICLIITVILLLLNDYHMSAEFSCIKTFPCTDVLASIVDNTPCLTTFNLLKK